MEVEIEDLHVQMEDISKTKQAVSRALYFLQILQVMFLPLQLSGFDFQSSEQRRANQVVVCGLCLWRVEDVRNGLE